MWNIAFHTFSSVAFSILDTDAPDGVTGVLRGLLTTLGFLGLWVVTASRSDSEVWPDKRRYAVINNRRRLLNPKWRPHPASVGFTTDVVLVCVFVSIALILVYGGAILLHYNATAPGFQYVETYKNFGQYNSDLQFGVDGLSLIFLLLTLIIFPFCFLSVRALPWQRQVAQFCGYLILMEFFLILTFTVTDLFYFYVFFESLLIPMFALIGIWGARERKIKAAYYFFLYTLFGSLVMLFGVIYLYFLVGSTNYYVILNVLTLPEQQRVIWLCFFLAFAVKMPLFPLHIWLPEAHVEAPTVGSMLLASLLLKLGGYGFLRFSISMLPDAAEYYTPLVATMSILGVVYGSLSTMRQIDLKRVIAYSSVAHMNLVMLGLFSGSAAGLAGAIYLMVGHGVVSTALFFCVGVLYDRYHSRLIRYYGGLTVVMPLFSGMFFAFTLANMGFPGTSNFLGEVLVFVGVFPNNSLILLFAATSIVLSAIYSIWLYNRIAFGALKTKYISRFTDLDTREVATLLFLLMPMLVLGVNAQLVLDFCHLSVKSLLVLF